MLLNSRFPLVCKGTRNVASKKARAEKLLLSLAVAAVLGHAPSAKSETYTWTSTLAGPFSWDNAGGQNNWSIAGFPNAVGDIANITSDLIESQFIDLNQTITLGTLNIGDVDGLSTFTIQPGVAGSLNFNNGLLASEINQIPTSAGDTIMANISTVGALNVSNSSASSLILTGTLSSSATSGTQILTNVSGNVRYAGDILDGATGGKIALVQNGFGTMSLLGNNSFSGGVTLNSGSLNIGNATSLGTTASTLTINGGTITNSGGIPITLVNNNAQVWAGDFSFNGADLDLGTGAVTLTGSRQVSVNAGNLIVGGVISDGGNLFGLTKVGNGTLTLASANNIGGPITINGGRLAIRTAGALGTETQVTVNSGGTLMLENGITVNGKTLLIAGDGAGQGGALRSEGDNVWGGDITANTSAIVRIVSAFGVLTLNGNIATSGTNANGLVLHGDGVMNGVISGDGSLTRSNNDGGTWTFNGVNTYTGNTTISNGAIRLGNANAIQNSAVTLNSSAFDGLQFAPGIGNFNLVALTGGPASNFTLNDTGGQAVNLTIGSANTNTTFAGIISGTGSLTKVGTGALALTNGNLFSGGIAVNGGTLTASDPLVHSEGSASVNNPLGTGAVTLAEGTALQLRANGNPDALPQVLAFGNAVTLTGSAAISVDRQSATAGTGKILGLGALTIGDLTLTVTGGGSTALRFDAVNLTGNATLNPTTANMILGGVTETGGARSLTKTGNGRLILAGNAAHTGGTFVNAGTLEVAGSHSGSATVNGGTLLVTGAFGGGVTVTTGSLQIGNGGYSGVMTGNIVNDAVGANLGVFFNRADNSTYAGQISGAGAFIKNGSGTLVLTGANSYTGSTTINNGTLMLDYASSPTILDATSPLLLGGTLYIKGNGTGVTAQTLGNPTANAGFLGRIVLDNNGGAGTTITLGDAWTFNSGALLHFDLSRGGTILSNPQVVNGVVSIGNVARAAITGTDGRTYFATSNAGTLVPQTAVTQLVPGSTSGTTNFQVSGDVVTTGPVATNTLRIDTTAGPGSLDIAGGSLTFANTAILMDGSNDFEIKRSSGTGTVANAVIHQYGTGTLVYSAPIATGGGFTKGGSGLLIANMETGAPASVTVTEGMLRIALETARPTGSITLSGGGILELGSGDFMGGFGTGNGQIRIIGDGGLSAFGATRVVNFGGVSNTISWDNANFLPNNATFSLSSTRSNALLDLQNPINLGSLTRTVRVFDGSAPIDAQLSGALSGTGELRKVGPGALALNGASTFVGLTSVREGTLAVNGRLAGAVSVVAGTLQGHGDGVTTGLINSNVTVGNGVGSHDAVLSPGNGVGTLTTLGALALASDAVFKFELDSGLGTADQMVANGISIDPGSTFQSLDLAVVNTALALNTTFIALNNTSFAPINGAFANLAQGATFTLGLNTFQANYFGGDGNDLVFTAVVPEPTSAVSLMAGCIALLGLRRPRRSRAK